MNLIKKTIKKFWPLYSVLLVGVALSAILLATYPTPSHYDFEKNDLYYVKVLSMDEGNFTIEKVDVKDWTYGSLFGKGTGAPPTFIVNKTTFLKKANKVGVVTIIQYAGHKGAYVLTPEAYYILKGTDGKRLVVENSNVYVVVETEKSVKDVLYGSTILLAISFVIGIVYTYFEEKRKKKLVL